mgnify:CR=1 FL=1
MKNYIRDVIDRYIKHDYPEEVNQDFRTWLTDCLLYTSPSPRDCS